MDRLQVLRVGNGAKGFCAVRGQNFELLAIHEGRETEEYLDALKELARQVARRFGDVMDGWDCNRGSLAPVEALLQAFMSPDRTSGRAN